MPASPIVSNRLHAGWCMICVSYRAAPDPDGGLHHVALDSVRPGLWPQVDRLRLAPAADTDVQRLPATAARRLSGCHRRGLHPVPPRASAGQADVRTVTFGL